MALGITCFDYLLLAQISPAEHRCFINVADNQSKEGNLSGLENNEIIEVLGVSHITTLKLH